MSDLPAKQYQFRDGHWHDAWNDDRRDDGPFDDWNNIGDTWAPAILQDRLGWCGCIDLDVVLPMFVAYLSGEWGTYGERSQIIHYDHTDPAKSMIAWCADAAGFTQHGGNVGGSWVEPAGERWLELARDWKPHDDPE